VEEEISIGGVNNDFGHTVINPLCPYLFGRNKKRSNRCMRNLRREFSGWESKRSIYNQDLFAGHGGSPRLRLVLWSDMRVDQLCSQAGKTALPELTLVIMTRIQVNQRSTPREVSGKRLPRILC
jgi:hypothetical protein